MRFEWRKKNNFFFSTTTFDFCCFRKITRGIGKVRLSFYKTVFLAINRCIILNCGFSHNQSLFLVISLLLFFSYKLFLAETRWFSHFAYFYDLLERSNQWRIKNHESWFFRFLPHNESKNIWTICCSLKKKQTNETQSWINSREKGSNLRQAKEAQKIKKRISSEKDRRR